MEDWISPLNWAAPEFTNSQKMTIVAICMDMMMGEFGQLRNASDPSADSDSAFFIRINSTRDTTLECPLCLREGPNVGKTCSCGHQDFVMMRPCGHVLCAKPCFADWVRTVSSSSQEWELSTSTHQEASYALSAERLSLIPSIPTMLRRMLVVRCLRD
jgi:hypothetical protein